MTLFGSAFTSRNHQTQAVRDGNRQVDRLARSVARMLLWGCVLLLLVRGVASELSPGSQTVTPIHGVTGPVTVPSPSAHDGGPSGPASTATQSGYPAPITEGK
jgi:hypothetical protein